MIPADIDEKAVDGESPRQMVLRLAREKAEAVAGRLEDGAPGRVLGSDTIVVLDGNVLGKPRDAEHAVELLSSLLGRRHQVLTGVALVERANGRVHGVAVESSVTMRSAEPEEVRAYVATGEPLDKAGAYAVQGEGRRFVALVEGSETNVIGLPMDETLALLEQTR